MQSSLKALAGAKGARGVAAVAHLAPAGLAAMEGGGHYALGVPGQLTAESIHLTHARFTLG